MKQQTTLREALSDLRGHLMHSHRFDLDPTLAALLAVIGLLGLIFIIHGAGAW
jgi:hypothetical protein